MRQFKKVILIGQKYQNTMGQLISKHNVSYSHSDPFSYALGYTKGFRLTQEDAHSFNHTTISFSDHLDHFKQIDLRIFGIYDGHGGKLSSEYTSQKLPQNIISEFIKIESTKFKTLQGLVSHKIKNAFLQTDLDLYEYLSTTSGESSGTTAIVVIIIDEVHIFIVNVGDSRCILSTNGATKNLSFDHKPSNFGEVCRINGAEGIVHFDRVNGILALSRAFGDFNFKKRLINGTFISSTDTQVTVEPDIIYREIDQTKDEFLIIGCDGIYDVFTNDELIRFIRHKLALDLKLTEIIDKLLTLALDSADKRTGIGFDNMSIYIVTIQQHETFEQWHSRIKLKVEIENNLI